VRSRPLQGALGEIEKDMVETLKVKTQGNHGTQANIAKVVTANVGEVSVELN